MWQTSVLSGQPCGRMSQGRPQAESGSARAGGWQLNPSSPFGTYGHGNFQVLWEDGERVFCRAASHAHDGDCSAMLAVFPAGEHPTPAALNRLAHEHGLKDELDDAW